MLLRFIRRLGEICAGLSLKYVPDPYVLVIVLTLLAFAGALGAGASARAALDAWYGGVWSFLPFMAAFAVTLMAGDAIAQSPGATRFLQRLARIPKSPFAAVAFTALVAMLAALISWALGLIVGAVMAKQVAYQGRRRGTRLHYPLLIAAGYTSLMIWHSGLTTSAGLIMTDPSLIPDTFPDYVRDGIPLEETIGSAVNIVIVVVALVVIPLVMAALHPRSDGRVSELPDHLFAEMTPAKEQAAARTATADAGKTTSPSEASARPGVASRLNHSPVLALVIAVLPAYYFIKAWVLEGEGLASLTLNSINAFFLFAAMVLWRTPVRVVEQMQRSASTVAQIIFQFPFYAGISGLLTGTSLAAAISGFFAGISTPATWPVIGLISAGVVNLFIPSGGGQWIAQGPILLETTRQLGMPLSGAVIIEMMGDQLTNMVQPFWALPALALARLSAREIIGYTAVAMIAGFIIMAVAMTIFLGFANG